eukprot:8329355-Heterocapsa_arctica.AAC.1
MSLDNARDHKIVYCTARYGTVQPQRWASAYAGWGMWSRDNADFKENGPLKGKDQGSDRAE